MINGKTWIFYDNLSFAQFYAASADMRDPYYVYGGLQDNGTWGGPSMSREGEILTDFWYNVGGGDGFHTQNDPTDWRTVYSESQGGSISRWNVETRESRSIRPNQANIANYKDYFATAPAQPAAKPQPAAGRRPPGGPDAPDARTDARPIPIQLELADLPVLPQSPDALFRRQPPLQVDQPGRHVDDRQPRPLDQ